MLHSLGDGECSQDPDVALLNVALFRVKPATMFQDNGKKTGALSEEWHWEGGHEVPGQLAAGLLPSPTCGAAGTQAHPLLLYQWHLKMSQHRTPLDSFSFFNNNVCL
jgi:hypothetical protein